MKGQVVKTKDSASHESGTTISGTASTVTNLGKASSGTLSQYLYDTSTLSKINSILAEPNPSEHLIGWNLSNEECREHLTLAKQLIIND